jgi:hypothetical protein
MHLATRLATASFPCLLLSLSASAATPILEYTFDTTSGSTVTNSGSASNADLLLNGTASTVSGGVNGTSAYSNNVATRDSSPTGYGSLTATQSDAISGLQSLTYSMWFKMPAGAPIGVNSASPAVRQTSVRVFDSLGGPVGGAGGFSLIAGSGTGSADFRLETVRSATRTFGAVNSATSFGATDEWVFMAVTYDSTLADTSSNVKFYIGSETSPVTAVATTGTTLSFVDGEPVTVDSVPAFLGNYGNDNSFNRAFIGLMDNVRIYGSTSDGSGALGLADLEALRVGDVPEPTALLPLALTGLLLRRGRRR